MKRAFTLIELLVVVVVLVTLMMIVFRLSSLGADSEYRNRTIVRLQRLENCLSGYYSAFGSYPPVKLHGTRDIYAQVGAHGIQTDNRNESIWGWSRIGEQAEYNAWRQVEAACRSQPVACRFPFPSGYHDLIVMISDEMRERANSGEEEFRGAWENEATKAKLVAGFDDGVASGGSTGRFDAKKDEIDWRNLQLFQFGLMSFLLPRYLVMMNGAQGFFTGGFKQWDSNNVMPSDPFTGITYNNWGQLRNYVENDNKGDLAHVANIPSQAACARWMPNLERICICNYDRTIFGISLKDDRPWGELRSDNYGIEVFSPSTESAASIKDQYILDLITVQDGWWHDFYYYSPEPFQTYSLWSAGPNGRTFPPWISRMNLSAKASQCISLWTSDDIIRMSN